MQPERLGQYYPACTSCPTHSLPYECHSIMHYGTADFSRGSWLLALVRQQTQTAVSERVWDPWHRGLMSPQAHHDRPEPHRLPPLPGRRPHPHQAQGSPAHQPTEMLDWELSVELSGLQDRRAVDPAAGALHLLSNLVIIVSGWAVVVTPRPADWQMVNKVQRCRQSPVHLVRPQGSNTARRDLHQAGA